MSEADRERDIWNALMHLNRQQAPSRERLLDYMFVLLTREYGFNRVAFYEVDFSEKFAKPMMVMGPDTEDEHGRIVEIIRGLTLDDILAADRLGRVEQRTSSALDERFRGYNVPLDAPSRFKTSFDTGASFYGIDEPSYQLTDIDKRIEEIFGTNNYALITVKGAEGKVIGWYYADYRFSHKSMINGSGKPVIDKEDIRYIVELTSLYIQLTRAYEAAIEHEKLRAMEEGLRRAAHEIRGPLVTIGAGARLILSVPEEEDSVRGYAEMIRDRSLRLERLLNEIRDVSRSNVITRPSQFSLYELVGEQLQLVSVERKERGKEAKYSLDKPTEEPKVYADSGHIEDVVLGLARNALEAIDDDPNRRGILTVTFSQDADNAYVYFYNPQHIAPDILPNIFNPYFTTKREGLGLGLNIYQKYMRANSGDLTVKTSPEEGTTFTMQLPLYKGQSQKQA